MYRRRKKVVEVKKGVEVEVKVKVKVELELELSNKWVYQHSKENF